MAAPTSKTIVLKNVRLSFPSLFKKAVFDGQETKYEATLLVPKNSAQAKKLQKMAEDFAAEVFGGKEKIPNSLKYTALTDGDTKDYDGYEGMLAFKGGSGQRITIVDRDKTPLVEEDGKPVAGDYVNAVVGFWYSSHPKGGKQILGNLSAIQFVKEGEHFGAGGVNVDEAFDDLGDEDEDEY